MSVAPTHRWPGNAVKRTRQIELAADDQPATTSPWDDAVLVDPTAPRYGRYGDERWTFGAQAPNHTPTRADVRWGTAGTDGPWPTRAWVTVGRDLGMAMLGRTPDRHHSRRSGRKPATVANALRQLAAIARWADSNQLGTPDHWDETIGPQLLDAIRRGELTGRRPADNSARLYLDTLSKLWLHRAQIAHSPDAPPWPDFATTSPAELVHGDIRPTLTPHLATEVIDPAVWWAMVRFALRFVLVYRDDLLSAWDGYLARGRTGRHATRTGRHMGPRTVELLETFAADPDSRVPVDADGQTVLWQLCPLVGLALTAFQPRNPQSQRCLDIVDAMVAAGRTTRYWFGPPVTEVLRSDGTRSRWVDHIDTSNVIALTTRLRDACYLLIGALGALRDSEIQGLDRGCVTIADGGYVLNGHIIKGEATPAAARWWVDPLVARCIDTLEQLGEHLEITSAADGESIDSDRLLFGMSGAGFARAGIGSGSSVMSRLVGWINDNADELDLPRVPGDGPAIPVAVTPHQLRTTFAAVAAMEPDGPLGVARQLHDSFTLASAYMANTDRKWFEVHRQHRDQVTVGRLRGYLSGGLEALTGPGASGLSGDLHVAEEDAALLAVDGEYAGLVDELLAAAGRSFGSSNLSHCRGKSSDARCSTVFTALDPDAPFTPNFAADVCFGTTVADDCRNVVYDPPGHLPVWDLALAAYEAELAQLAEGRDAAHVELTRCIDGARTRIAAMEQACETRPRQVLDRLVSEMERYLDYVRFEVDVPGASAQYRQLYQAARRRVLWLREKTPADQQPDIVVPAEMVW